MLGIYGALDTRVAGSQAAAKAALDRAGLVNDLVVEPNADHAFFNDTGPRYNAAAAADAWRRLLDWFDRYLAGNDQPLSGDSGVESAVRVQLFELPSPSAQNQT